MISRGRSMPTCAAARGFAPRTCSRRPERGARQHVVDDEHDRERDEQADVDARARDRRAACLSNGITLRLRRCRIVGSWNGPLIRMFGEVDRR